MDDYFDDLLKLYNSENPPKVILISGNKGLGKFTPSHLRQHMTLGDLVQASFIEDDGMKWLEDIKDLTP